MSNTAIIALCVLALAVGLFSITRANAQSAPRVSAAELSQRLQAREPLLLIDVRTPPEWEDGVIDGTQLLPLDQLDAQTAAITAKLTALPDTTAVLICRSGARATRAAAMLAKKGIAKLAVLDGGMLAWKAAGLATVTPKR